MELEYDRTLRMSRSKQNDLARQFHHKGQIVAMLRILGYPAPDTDLQAV